MRAVGTPVFVSKGQATPLEKIKIGGGEVHDERWLQELIRDHPELLPLNQIEPGLSTLVPVCLELPLRCGFLDNFFMTPDGDIVIVEVKLWRNPEMRRAVMAQALDYASAMFELSYEDLDAAVQNAELTKQGTLYEIVTSPTSLDEAEFIDAVTHRLKTGRIVVLVVGDGIRSELEALNDGLQAHAGFRFTFGLVELSVYRDAVNNLTVVPRTLLATHRVERGVIKIEGDTSFTSQVKTPEATKGDIQTLSSDAFYDAMRAIDPALPDKISALLAALSPLGVYPEYKKSMILRWGTPDGEIANIGYVMRNGDLWTDQVLDSLKSEIATRVYLSALADACGGEVEEMSGRPTVRLKSKAPKIFEFTEAPESWAKAVSSLRSQLSFR